MPQNRTAPAPMLPVRLPVRHIPRATVPDGRAFAFVCRHLLVFQVLFLLRGCCRGSGCAAGCCLPLGNAGILVLREFGISVSRVIHMVVQQVAREAVAGVQFENPRGKLVDQIAVVRHHHNRSFKLFERRFERLA